MIEAKSISRILFLIPVILLLLVAVACGSEPEASAPSAPAAATEAPAAAQTSAAPQAPAAPEPSATAPAFRAASGGAAAPTATPAPVMEQTGEIKVDTLVIAVDPSRPARRTCPGAARLTTTSR